MLTFTFRIVHHGDWSETIDDAFPDVLTTIVHSYRPEDVTIMMVEATNVDDDGALVEWFETHPAVVSATLSSYDPARHNAYLVLEVDYDSVTGFESVMDVVTRNQCSPTLPPTNEDGWERWTILAPDREAANRTFHELQSIGDVDVVSLTDADLGSLLTTVTKAQAAIEDLSPRQREILTRAVAEGYYDTPRQVDLTDLAEADETSVSTVGEHLQRSEGKILRALLPLLAD